MQQTKPVNVAAVPQRSPFRYPGGKTWLVPFVRTWLKQVKPRLLVEPFTGGGIIGLTAGMENLAEHVILVERDENVASVWKTILNRNAHWLMEQIQSFNMTRENLVEELQTKPKSIRHKAFHTILKNRTYHGGIMCHGSGLIKFGENGKGVASRWYADTLVKRIKSIYECRSKFTFIEGDAFKVIPEYHSMEDAAFFVDPPYTASKKKAGKRLYQYNELDHDELFSLMASAKGRVMLTYDEDEAVAGLAEKHNLQSYMLPMKSRQHVVKNEAIIAKDFSWVEKAEKQKSLF